MIKPSSRKLPIAKVIAVDVDGTLIVGGTVNKSLVKWCQNKREEGFSMILWSLRGESHAKKMAEWAGVTDIFHNIIGKPGYIVDDKGWSWTKFTRRVTKWQKRKNEN